MAEIVRIVVASPGDVLAERDAVERVCGELNSSLGRHFNVYLQCDRWEKAARPGMHKDGPQGRVDEALQIPDCDVLLGLLWTRFGTPVKDAESGTEHEFNLAYEAWKKQGTPDVWFYFKEKGVFFKTEQETKQFAKVQRFRKRFPPEGLYWTFQETEDLEREARRHLEQYLTERHASDAPSPAAAPKLGHAVETTKRLETIRRIYLDYLVKQHARIDPRGIPQTDSELSLPLDDVYVSLSVERESQAQDGVLEWRIIPADIDVPDHPELSFKAGSVVPWWTDSEAGGSSLVSQPIDLPWAVRTNSRMVVLGDPGAGKTTLLRFLAVRFAQARLDGTGTVADKEGNEYGPPRLPLFLRVAEFADTYRRDSSITLLDFLPAALGDLPISPNERAAFVQDALGKGALILLDGLDEVATSADRAGIARRIDSFVAGLETNNRVIVTSRVAGYQESRLGGAFTQVTMRDMDDSQIACFLENWCLACERFRHPTADAPKIDHLAREESGKLRQSIAESEGVRRLAKNPLLLTILALIHRNIGSLPQRRVELYELATRTLLRDWRLAQAQKEARAVEVERAKNLLGPLAFWMHENEPTGLVHEKDAFEQLCRAYAEPRGMSPKHPDIKREVEEFLRLVREHTGMFVERAPGRYGFMHLTFEEYFAALHIIADPDLAPDLIRPIRHSPRWEEPIRLAIASERQIVAARIVRAAIWRKECVEADSAFVASDYEEILRRDLLLAARCLGDCATIEPALAREVAAELVAICLNRDGNGVFGPLQQRARDALGALRMGEVGTEAVRALLAALKDEAGDVRSAAARALGTAGHGSAEALSALRGALKDEEPYVRSAAAEALGTAGPGSGEAVRALLDALKEGNPDVRRAAARALGTAGQESEEALTGLVDALRDEKSSVRSAAAGALGTAGPGSEEKHRALVAALKDKDPYVRYAAARALGTAGQESEEALRALLDALKDKQSDVQHAAARALGTAGQESEEALRALLDSLKDKELYLRYAAALVRGTAGQESEEPVPALIAALRHEDSDVRSVSAWALGLAEPRSEEAVPALLAALNDEDWNVRDAAWESLSRIVAAREAARDHTVARGVRSLTGGGEAARSLATGNP